jgi:branched-chain amino acid transport system substrate-binding protein
MKKIFGIFIVAAFVLGFFSASSALAAPQAEAKSSELPAVIKVGVLAATSGNLESIGRGITDGIKAAGLEINNSADFSFDIELLIEDTEITASVGVAAYESLKAQGVQLVIGATGSSVSKAVAEKTAVDKIVQISYSSTASSLTNATYDYFYRTVPSDAFQAKALEKLLENKTNVVIVNIANAWGQGLADGVKALLEDAGTTVSDSIAYAEDTTDFSSVVTSVKAAVDADGVLMISYTEDGRSLITELRAGGVDLDLFGTDGTGDQAMVNTTIAADIVADIEGFRGTVPHQSVAGENNFNNYVDALAACKTASICADDDATRVYGDTAYDALWVGALAVKLAGDYTGEKIKAKMSEAGSSFDGATGNKAFDEFGDIKSASYDFYRFVDGDYEVYYTYVAGEGAGSGAGAPGFEVGMLLISFLAMGTIVVSLRKRKQ